MLGSYRTAILPIHAVGLFEQAVDQVVALLRRGEMVVLPTETVYGLAANALDAAAVRRVFAVKGRPPNNPVIVHVVSLEMARRCVAAWPDAAERLARAFWPGPLTLVLPKAAAIPAEVTAGGPTVAIRWPAHAFIQSVIERCGFPLAAPSANLSTQTSPTLASHVQQALDGLVPIIVDGGPCEVGIESTVLDLTTAPPRVLRPGMVQESAVASVVGELQPDPLALGGRILKSPGLLARHYAPATPLWVAQWRDDQDLRRQLERRLPNSGQRPSDPEGCVRQVCVVAHTRIPAGFGWARLSVLPHQPATYARALYAELHACDALKPRMIVIEAVPESPEWRAVADRLRRAAGRS